MGKATGFLEYGRENNTSAEPKERIKNYNEFHTPMSKTQRREQAARCMNCGVPFCQSAMKLGGMVSGCPLHNLIPEWNDEIYNGNWQHALSRLMKTKPENNPWYGRDIPGSGARPRPLAQGERRVQGIHAP